MSAHRRIVYWEDEPTRFRAVVAYCRRCYPNGPVGTTLLVSPAGVVHQTQEELWADRTFCGHDARGSDWWWRT